MNPAEDIGEDGGDSMLAAEYALGLLGPAERAAFAARLEREPALRAELRLWQSRLSGLDAGFAEARPPGETFARIEARLFPTPARAARGWWHSLPLWRGLAAASLAVAVLAVGVSVTRPPAVDPQAFAVQLVAALRAQEGSGVEFVALYDAASGQVRLTALSGEPVPQRDYELWLIAGGGAPVSMGVLPAMRGTMAVNAALRPQLDAGATLAVSLEPLGGSPTGSPTGPVVALGPAVAI